jgi:hypothetical protein
VRSLRTARSLDRNRRYETANSLAMDVQRYLADEPVLACPPTKLRKNRYEHQGPIAQGIQPHDEIKNLPRQCRAREAINHGLTQQQAGRGPRFALLVSRRWPSDGATSTAKG